MPIGPPSKAADREPSRKCSTNDAHAAWGAHVTPDESRILDLLRDHYGPSNNLDAIFFTEHDEAVIFATDRNGVAGICSILLSCR